MSEDMFDTEETNAQDSAEQNSVPQDDMTQNSMEQENQEQYREESNSYEQNLYAKNDAEQNAYGQSGAEQNPYEQSEIEQNSYEQNGAEANSYGQVHAEQEYNRTDAYTQNTTQGFYKENKEPYQPVSQAFGITSMVLGILSLVLFCTCINIPLAIAAIIFGIIQLTKKGTSKAMPVAGIVTSALSIVLFILAFFVFILSADFSKDIKDGLQEYQFNNEYDYQFPNDFFNNNEDDSDGQATF